MLCLLQFFEGVEHGVVLFHGLAEAESGIEDPVPDALILGPGREVPVPCQDIRSIFGRAVVKKLETYGIEMTEHVTVDDGLENIRAAIDEMRRTDVELILCTGGMSVDPDDNTPGAIRQSGARIVTYGAPVLPGAMFLLGYYDDGMPVMGLPGCVMYAKATVFDLALPRIAAGVEMTRDDFVDMGEGGLCLGCGQCRYPVCPFGK